MDWPVYYRKSIAKQKLIGTQNWHKQTQVLHRMRMRQFTPRQPVADITLKPREFKSDPEMSLHHDDLYARAWEYDFEQPIFDANNDKAAPPNPQETPLQSDYSTEEMRNTPGNPHVRSP